MRRRKYQVAEQARENPTTLSLSRGYVRPERVFKGHTGAFDCDVTRGIRVDVYRRAISSDEALTFVKLKLANLSNGSAHRVWIQYDTMTVI